MIPHRAAHCTHGPLPRFRLRLGVMIHNVDHGMYLTANGAAGISPEYLETMRTWLAAHVHTAP